MYFCKNSFVIFILFFTLFFIWAAEQQQNWIGSKGLPHVLSPPSALHPRMEYWLLQWYYNWTIGMWRFFLTSTLLPFPKCLMAKITQCVVFSITWIFNVLIGIVQKKKVIWARCAGSWDHLGYPFLKIIIIISHHIMITFVNQIFFQSSTFSFQFW